MTLALTALILLFAQQPPPAASAPQPPAASQSTPTTPSQPAPPPPPRPMVPVSPHSPSDLDFFLRTFHSEKSLAEENQAYFKSAQDHLNADKAKMDGFTQILEDEFRELKKKEGWGEDVRFNPQTEKFEKPVGAGAGAGVGTAEKKEEKKP